MPVRKRKHKRSGKVRSRTAAPARAKKPAVALSNARGPARLIFPRAQENAGFTPGEISPFNDRNIRPVVRELIQNSLDAAIGISRRPAIVRFSVETHSRDSIPSLGEYREAFQAARVKHGVESAQANAANVIADIAEGLEAEAMPFLFIEDNGVGLNDKRMEAILGNGVNVKEGKQAIGAYGNGHLPVFCQSRLRYVLYGSVDGSAAKGRMFASGHAIVASHPGRDKVRRSNNGYYAVRLPERDDEHNVYPENGQVPQILKGRLERIRDKFGSGTVVAVPGFNYFGGRVGPIAEKVRQVAALNFFPAVHSGDLEVHVVEDDKATVSLTKSNLADCLENQQDDRSGGEGGFPVGVKAAAAYRTMREGVKHSIPVAGGKIRMFLRQGSDVGGSHHVTFCRNGMWVTDKVRMLGKGEFRDNVPFDALLLVSVDECEAFHALMTEAEGPMHINLDAKRMSVKHKEKLRAGFRSVRDFLRDAVAKSDSKAFMSDFYSIETGEAVGGGRSALSVIRGTAEADASTFAYAASVKSKRKRKGVKSAPMTRTGKTMPMRVLAHRTGANTRLIRFAFPEDCDNCELRVRLDNGVDPSCTGALERVPLFIRGASIDGNGLPLTGEADRRQGIIVGGARKGDRRTVSVEFEPGQLRESSLQSLACEFYRRAARALPDGEAVAS